MHDINQRLYDEATLPEAFLTPPIKPPHPNVQANWKRNWNIYHVGMNWNGDTYGRYIALAGWVARIDGKKRLTRQRIEAIMKQIHWLLRGYMDIDYSHETMEEHTSTPQT